MHLRAPKKGHCLRARDWPSCTGDACIRSRIPSTEYVFRESVSGWMPAGGCILFVDTGPGDGHEQPLSYVTREGARDSRVVG